MIHKYCSSFTSSRTPPSAFADTSPKRGGLLRPLIWGYPWNRRSAKSLKRREVYFRPLFWGYLWNLCDHEINIKDSNGFPSPNLGLSLKWALYSTIRGSIWYFRPLIWGYLWNIGAIAKMPARTQYFRPLIWGYLWNITRARCLTSQLFPSPNLGLSLKSESKSIGERFDVFPSPNLGLSLK